MIKIKLISIITMSLVFLLTSPISFASNNSTILDFESGTLQGWNTRRLAKEYSVKLVTDIVRKGKYAARFEVRQGDKIYNGSFRAEIKDKFNAPIGKDLWYGFSTYIPASFPTHDNRCVIAQWNGEPDTEVEENADRSPPLAIRFIKGALRITLRHHSDKIMKENGKEIILYEQKDFPRDKWNDFVLNINFTHSNKGFVKAWLNAKQIVNYSGPVGYNDDKGPYFKMGLYRNDVPETYVIYHDEFRRGSSYKEVNPASNSLPRL